MRKLSIFMSVLLLSACGGGDSSSDSSSISEESEEVAEVVEEQADDKTEEQEIESTDNEMHITDASTSEINIFDAILTNTSGDCADYVNTYDADVLDIQNSIDFNADVTITSTDSECTFASNSVPNHNFNDLSAAFAGGAEGSTIAETDTERTITRDPFVASQVTALTQETKNAIFLNGVGLDILSAGCYRPTDAGADEDGNVNIGCASDADWLLDPLSTEHKFGADEHNAHTQPGGLYHYHGSPNAMFNDDPGPSGSPVIGFAADGFPIYGSYFFDEVTGSVRKAVSGYTLKQGSRGTKSDTNPGGEYTGIYNDDWEFTNAGDLDQCNGMTVNGQYGYYAIDAYPWVMACFSGTPHESFGGGNDAAGGPDGGGPNGPPPGA